MLWQPVQPEPLHGSFGVSSEMEPQESWSHCTRAVTGQAQNDLGFEGIPVAPELRIQGVRGEAETGRP